MNLSRAKTPEVLELSCSDLDSKVRMPSPLPKDDDALGFSEIHAILQFIDTNPKIFLNFRSLNVTIEDNIIVETNN